MLPDPDSNPELAATPAERGTSADATVLAEAASHSRDRRAGCPPAAPAGKKFSDQEAATTWTATDSTHAPTASSASVPSACPFSANALGNQEHLRPVIESDSQNETLEEHQHPSPQHHRNSKEYQRVTADVFRSQDANASTDVENVFLETCQSSDGNFVPTTEETSSSVDFVSFSAIPASPDDRRPTEDFVESDLKYLEEEGPEIVDFFKVLIGEGRLKPGDCGVPLDSKPAWVDDEKVRLGQQFAQKYFFGLVFAEMISLFLLFSSPGSLHSLIFSGNSDTPFKLDLDAPRVDQPDGDVDHAVRLRGAGGDVPGALRRGRGVGRGAGRLRAPVASAGPPAGRGGALQLLRRRAGRRAQALQGVGAPLPGARAGASGRLMGAHDALRRRRRQLLRRRYDL